MLKLFSVFYYLKLLDTIDEQFPSWTLNKPAALRRVFVVLLTCCICLLAIHYLKYSSALIALLKAAAPDLYLDFRRWEYYRLASYAWWTFWHITGYLIIPLLIIKAIIRDKSFEYGLRWKDTSAHWKGYVLLTLPILFFILIVSFGENFVNHYPFYKLSKRSWFDLIAWETLYLIQFFCLEFFFRGFIIQGLRPALGANAVWIMCVPYMMIHLPKLWPEAAGAILFGFFLGILALRSRSIWGGFFVHATIAISMDIASLLQQGALPKQLFP